MAHCHARRQEDRRSWFLRRFGSGEALFQIVDALGRDDLGAFVEHSSRLFNSICDAKPENLAVRARLLAPRFQSVTIRRSMFCGGLSTQILPALAQAGKIQLNS